MNARLLLAISSVAALSSCSTSYKAQTPDDVYYSPAKPAAGYVETEKKKDPEQQAQAQNARYQSADEYYYSADDRYLRWKVRNPQRWSTFDTYAYDMYPSCTSSYAPWNNYWNSYYSWNNGYNPYCHRVIVANPKSNAAVYNRVRTYTPGAYTNTAYNNRNNRPVKVPVAYSPNGTYNTSNSSNTTKGSSNSLGNSLKKIFSNSGSSYNNNSSSSSSDRPSRSYTPSSSSSSSSGSSGRSSSSGGSSGGGGGVSRPSRGG